jgi:small subunit ribosomal protein S13
MPRIAGVTIPAEKRILISLTYIYGIGPKVSRDILNQAKINPSARAHTLSEQELDVIRGIISHIKLEGDLRRDTAANIRRLRDIGAYRGGRHAKGLPVRGQGTKTNARTRKGKKITVGSGRKPTASKT